MTRNRTIVTVAAIVLLVGIGVYAVYDQVLRGDTTPALALPSQQATASSDTGAAATTDPVASQEPAAGESATTGTGTATGSLSAETAVGTWDVASGSVAGYRVREQLANLPAESDAIGRTESVTGSATVAASGDSVQLSAADFSVDTTSIASDKDMRDNRMRDEGLQTDQYPTATFVLTKPLEVPAAIFDGDVVDVTLEGDLTLHGTTKAVSIPAKAQVSGDQVQVQGSLTFPLSDYAMTAPNVGGFILSIADEGTLEFLIVLDRAG